MNTNLPNVILGGAPKSGTGSVFRWLLDHPQVCGSKPKETFFLMDYDHPLAHPTNNYHEQGIEGYYKYFEHCNSSAKVICEATTHYIYQQTAINVLSTLSSLPKIIFILRKPEERTYSSYKYTLNNLSRLKTNFSFSDYIQLIQNTSFDNFKKYFRDSGSAYVLFNDIQYSCYIKYLEQWQSKMANRIYIFLFEEMLESKRDFMKKISEVVGIDSTFYDKYTFSHYNETYEIKNKFLHSKIFYLSKFLQNIPFKDKLKNTYLYFQGKKSKGKTMEDEKCLSELASYFITYNQDLSNQFNLDISYWE